MAKDKLAKLKAIVKRAEKLDGLIKKFKAKKWNELHLEVTAYTKAGAVYNYETETVVRTKRNKVELGKKELTAFANAIKESFLSGLEAELASILESIPGAADQGAMRVVRLEA